jgi:hypothetical protein
VRAQQEGEKMKHHYICNLENGKTLDFGKKCTKVIWCDDMFKMYNNKDVVIAIIPIINVESFLLVEE